MERQFQFVQKYWQGYQYQENPVRWLWWMVRKKILTDDGEDITEAFIKGAEKTWKIAEILDVERAILQTRSPSCGYGIVYDGTFTGNLVEGNGFTAALLEEKKGIKVYTENNFQEEDW